MDDRIPVALSLCSSEAKPFLEDKLDEFSASLVAAYDSGEILSALEEGPAGWQKWVKSFGKSQKRKVIPLSLTHIFIKKSSTSCSVGENKREVNGNLERKIEINRERKENWSEYCTLIY